MQKRLTSFKHQTQGFCLACALTLQLGYVEAQNTQLSPQQHETVRLFLNKTLPRYACLCESIHVPMSQVMENAVKNIDPILVSRHLIFSKNWLKFIGEDENRQVTRQQFKKWTDNLDKLFECYEKFMGQKPFETDVIFINLHEQTNPSKGVAHAYIGTICINAESEESFENFLSEIRFRGTPTYVMSHELAHCFSMGGPLAQKHWTGELETVAEMLVAYALENENFEFGYPAKITGSVHRKNLLKAATDNLENETIKPFSYDHGSGYDLYMFGLVDKIGWDTLKKVIHSYHQGTYTQTKKYDDSQTMLVPGKFQFVYPHRMHEFFDRTAHFHNDALEHAKSDPAVLQYIPIEGRNLTGEQVLRSFPDEGWFLDEYFTVPTKPNNSPSHDFQPGAKFDPRHQ